MAASGPRLEKFGLDVLASWSSSSWCNRLLPDPQHSEHTPNRTSRPVLSGHYVPVVPKPLPKPELVALSPSFLNQLSLSEEECRKDKRFVDYFSGNVESFNETLAKITWATPYALAIYGQDMIDNCPFKTGDGYGDGRAISIGEVLVPHTQERWEFQLKGAGPTPFCRGGDGRAVLRSSVREFLVSEAMHHLGIPTTRAISLVVSNEEVIQRAWYSGKKNAMAAFERMHPLQRMMFFQALRDPDVVIEEKAAISCRVAPSFMRVGHLQLFERRVKKARKKEDSDEIKQREAELKMIIEHAIFREFPEIDDSSPFQDQVLSMLEKSSKRISRLTADWIRVGFCQGNFNSDNCLVGGRTMDYGPFGLMEKFSPMWAMWVGSGQHFGFMNQPSAGVQNFGSLIEAVCPLLDEDAKKLARRMRDVMEQQAEDDLNDVWRAKLGLKKWSNKSNQLIMKLLRLMDALEIDYTLFWRQLAVYPETYLPSKELPSNLGELLAPLAPSFYSKGALSSEELGNWLKDWIKLLQSEIDEENHTGQEIAKGMRQVSPKYVPREWMLVFAYSEAEKGNYAPIHRLQKLFLSPYDEQKEEEAEFYRRAPDEVYVGAGKGGTAYMS
eukprot:CAMPEP_0201482438 /NCGR_PEP_ID=MMETSP0151_2-20130828/6728_1 /ASSEMBLY_ACC=CAM_ASM_000257 /TAXON_ID=200890 /ORGANISM="Paramoeba atlantica, Strain 621/1 / CCAP 1560/9" /LENGTH=610 /DNA_ID=CAMNT_0047865153 /DNA_START=89 /DNA_END=1921 /DNA_ORIENTATION=+